MIEIYSTKVRAEARARTLNSQDNGWTVVELDDGFGITHDGSPAKEPKGDYRWCMERREDDFYRRPVMRLKAC